mmetsp:Transcript_4402/g.6406  ORF Transcript_4402/g.6406 Transcript_4402/m.6406 type:complete len:130 (+) Transcript_4402:1288-1677(+)
MNRVSMKIGRKTRKFGADRTISKGDNKFEATLQPRCFLPLGTLGKSNSNSHCSATSQLSSKQRSPVTPKSSGGVRGSMTFKKHMMRISGSHENSELKRSVKILESGNALNIRIDHSNRISAKVTKRVQH